ncbi:MAG: tol-pal system-associated acyl-CoA thioesterase [Pseudomonadota bacterium]
MNNQEFVWPVRVYYEDTDAAGVVYYANYLRFMERARTEWLRALGFEQDQLRDQAGVIFAVRTAQLDYQRPARFNDRLHVCTRLIRMNRASLFLAQTVQLVDNSAPLCQGEFRIACLRYPDLRPTGLPPALRTALA